MKLSDMDFKDVFLYALFTSVWIAGTVYVFLHPSDIAFGTWAGMVSTMSCAFHWISVKDDKVPDAPAGN